MGDLQFSVALKFLYEKVPCVEFPRSRDSYVNALLKESSWGKSRIRNQSRKVLASASSNRKLWSMNSNTG